MNNPHLSAASGNALSWPVFLILLVENSHIHVRDHVMGVKVILGDSVVES